MGRWQYHAMRVPSRTWLDRDLPLQDVQCGPALSGPYSLKAKIDPEFGSLIAEDGELLLRERGTLIVAEVDDRVHGAAILLDATITGPLLEIQCSGFSVHGAQPYEGSKTWGGKTLGVSGHGVDVLDVVREHWAWLQSQPDGDLGIQLSATKTAFVVGTWFNRLKPKTPEEIEAEKKAKAKPSKTKAKTKAKTKPAPVEVADPLEFAGIWDETSRKPAAAPTKTVYWSHTTSWADKTDVVAKMEEFAQAAPFDYVETAAWSGTGDMGKGDIVLGLRFGYPRLGRAVTEPVFIEGENVLVQTPIRRGREGYANAVTIYGSGEGTAQKRASASVRDQRLRKATAMDASSVSSVAVLKARASAALARARHSEDVTTVVVSEHPSAPIGSYGVGDDITVVTGPSWQPVRLRVRITALDVDPETEATTITCARSDAWDYAGAGVVL